MSPLPAILIAVAMHVTWNLLARHTRPEAEFLWWAIGGHLLLFAPWTLPVMVRQADDPALIPLFRQAMDIWLKEMPAIPLLQWFHRIPHNQTYWKNWPSAQNPYMNSAYWVRTFLIVLLGLEPAQP